MRSEALKRCKTSSYLVCAILVAVLILNVSGVRSAQGTIILIAPGGIQAPFNELLPRFESKTGQTVQATFAAVGVTKEKVLNGEAFDAGVVQFPYSDVVASGNVVAASATPLATVAVGVAVAHGTLKPDISTPAAVKQMLLAAKSVSYPDPALGSAAGASFTDTLKKLGIAGKVQAKAKLGQTGADSMDKVVKGEVQIGLTFISEMGVPGLDTVGPLPRQISEPTQLVGFVSSHAKDPAGAKALLNFLSSPDAASVYKAHKMEPGR
jgi:molybdate transport system substrate-binding protein